MSRLVFRLMGCRPFLFTSALCVRLQAHVLRAQGGVTNSWLTSADHGSSRLALTGVGRITGALITAPLIPGPLIIGPARTGGEPPFDVCSDG